MLRRFRKRPECNQVDAPFDENGQLKSVEERFRPQMPQHELMEARPSMQQPHLQQNSIRRSNLKMAQRSSYELDVHLAQQQSPDTADHGEEHFTGQSYFHNDTSVQPQSNLLNAIHVQITPPSTIESRSQSRKRSREKLDKLAARLKEEQRRSPLHQEDWGHKRIGAHTASTRSPTRASRSSTVEAFDLRKSLLAKACGQLDLCRIPNSACITPSIQPLLHTVPTEENSILPESHFIGRVESHNSSGGVIGLDPSLDKSSFLSGQSRSQVDGRVMMHAYDYKPTPPQRRTKTGRIKSNATSDEAVKPDIKRVVSADIKENAAVRGANQANADVVDEFVNEREYYGSVGSAKDHGKFDSDREDDGFDAVELQLSAHVPVSEIVDHSVDESPADHEKDDLPSSRTKQTNQKKVTPTLAAPSKQTARKLPVILRAVSPIRSSHGQDPSGTKSVSVSVRGSALDASTQADKDKAYPDLDKKETKSSLLRKAASKQRRSPSPRRPSPPADRLSPADPAAESSASLPKSKLRRALRRSPSPSRDAPTSEPAPQPTVTRGIEPEHSKNVSGQPMSKFRRALTPNKRLFSRNGSAARQREFNQMAEKTRSSKGSDPPPDPPGSPSWKVGGTYSSRGVKGKGQAKQNVVKQCGKQQQSQPDVKRGHQHALSQRDQQNMERPEQQVFEKENPVPNDQTPAPHKKPSKPVVPMFQQLNPHQRRNYQKFVLLKKNESRRLQAQQDREKQCESTNCQTHIKPGEQIVPCEQDKQQQTKPQQAADSRAIQYEMYEQTKPNRHSKSCEKTQQQPPMKPEPRNEGAQSLQATFQMKKVQSSPSAMMSTMTSQTMNTTNTTTTSKFWDDIEEYQVSSSANPTNPPDRNVSFETGLHGNPRKFDNITEQDCIVLKRLNEKNKELQHFFKMHKLDENEQHQAMQNRTPPLSRMEAQFNPASPVGSALGSAFSLNLPLNKEGYFDDSDISALAMGDSATVYHVRTTLEAKQKSSDYWKEKYEKLKEKTQRANQVGDVNETLMEEDEGSFLRSKREKKSLDRDTQKEKNVRVETAPANDDQSQFLQQQQSLLKCGGYMGGKKAKGVAQSSKIDAKRHKLEIDSKKPVKSIFSRAQCFMPNGEPEVSLIEKTAERQDERNITRKVSSEDDLDAENIAQRFECTKLVMEEKNVQGQFHGVPNAEVIANQLHCARLGEAEDTTEAANDPRDDTPLGFESLNSDIRPLQPIGYVQRLDTPSPHLNASDPNLNNAIDGLACYDDPVYVMDDSDALKEWNKSRQTKALADELSGVASRGKSSADGSELSENAKLIFEAALKHDIKALRAQRSRSASRTPVKMRAASPVRSPPNILNQKSCISSSFEASRSSSVLSENFASNIPQDFATWFDLPSPGTSCIALIPMLKGHLRNAVVVELLSSFDGASNKIDAKGVHRITPRHRVNDVLHKSFTEYMDSPAIASKSSIDSEYMGPVIADGEDGSIRFANASIHLGGISDAASSHIKKREFQDAIDIYSTLLRSCQAASGWLVQQLIASTLHNLCVLHLWNEEYDLALQFSRESTRIENAGDNELMMRSWANMGLIYYALEEYSSAVVAFRNAIDISVGVSTDGETPITGRLQNNLGCVKIEISNIEEALNEFEQSLRCQKHNDSFDDADTSDAVNLLSISLTIFNIGVACARQRHYHTAMKHTEASLAMQEALLGSSSELADNTLFYLYLLRKVIISSHSPDRNTPTKMQLRESPPSSPSRAQPCNDGVLDILDVNPESPRRRVKQALVSEAEQQLTSLTKRNKLSYPMLSMGSLKVEATAVERVRECLDRFDYSLRNNSDRKSTAAIGRSLLCRKAPPGTKQPGIPSKLMSFGVKTLRKLEVQTELNDNLERYGRRHPLVGQSHYNLGLVLLCIENFEDSIDHFEKSIRINTHALGSRHPDVALSLMLMALAQFALERFEDSAKSMLQVRHLRENELGNKHHEIYPVINNLASVQFELGNLKQAEALLQEALDLQREIFFTDPEFLKGVSIVLFNIAFVHAKSGAFAKALIELEGALQIRQDILFEDATAGDITENMAYILAIHQLQNGSGNIDYITNEYITMLQKT